ncbi:MAG TPA: Ig-like domain-containing protein [Longimicrobiales bacterium]|nr:Ig-like domain-containing protein [Longimicrobiales bacterium]
MLRRLTPLVLLFLAAPVTAQDAASRAVRLESRPATVSVEVGASAALEVVALDASGQVLDTPVRVVGARDRLTYEDGRVTGVAVGSHELIATLVVAEGQAPLTLRVPVTVEWPAVARIAIEAEAGELYAGTTLGHSAAALHADGSVRPDAAIAWTSSSAAVASVDAFGNVTAHSPGRVTLTASSGGATASIEYDVEGLPATRLEIRGGADAVRTGDVQTFEAVALDASGDAVAGVPVTWATTFERDDYAQAGGAAPSQIRDGRFVADQPGVHTVIATAGPLTARRTFRVSAREVVQKLSVVGVGSTSRIRTTDLWPFEGVDGRDYALTGAKLSDGFAFVWDITDPSNIIKTDSIQADARTINDVKVSPDGRYGVLTREGASNRRNGPIILDLADPAHPKVATTFEDGITGGVHNVYATDDYLYALSNGDKYVIIDMSDIYAPKYVGEYDHPNSSIHDVWVHDGVAYSAEWGTGVVVVDVGNGRWGGSPANPVFVTSFPLPTGRTHAVFPYRSESSDRFYLFVGDEIMSRPGLAMEGPRGSWPDREGGANYAEKYDPATGQGGVPLVTQGYIQIVDFTDPANPEMVARYEVSEYGTHNMWVENDILYQGYYEGGVRIVDVSGELMGNLYTQGREIAVFKPFDPAGFVPNSTMVWGVIPYKGNIFVADTNSGLWAVRIQPPRPVS